MLEPPFAIVCSSLPIIKPLIAELAPSFITKRISFRVKGRFSKGTSCKLDSGHQKPFHRLDERVYTLEAAKANVLVDNMCAGDDPGDQHHYNEADAVKDTGFSRV